MGANLRNYPVIQWVCMALMQWLMIWRSEEPANTTRRLMPGAEERYPKPVNLYQYKNGQELAGHTVDFNEALGGEHW